MTTEAAVDFLFEVDRILELVSDGLVDVKLDCWEHWRWNCLFWQRLASLLLQSSFSYFMSQSS